MLPEMFYNHVHLFVCQSVKNHTSDQGYIVTEGETLLVIHVVL